jgi:ureidoglycolate lyase
MKTIKIKALNQKEFAPFGDVVEISKDKKPMLINNGTTERFHDLANIVTNGEDARTAISIFRAKPFPLPYMLTFMERHPFGSQFFMPLIPSRFLAIVAHDEDNKSGEPIAFMVSPNQGINFKQNIWHGALVALDERRDFLVIDREGEENNLEIYNFEQAYRMEE